jgi:hypothetical protein
MFTQPQDKVHTIKEELIETAQTNLLSATTEAVLNKQFEPLRDGKGDL